MGGEKDLTEPPDDFDAIRVVRQVRGPTPLDPAPELSPDREILIKREDLGPNGSFKWRGALCACASLKANGQSIVVTASTGNHGAATAWAAARLGLTAHVVVPVGASEVKCRQISDHGATLHHEAATMDQAGEYGKRLAEEVGGAWFEDGASEAQLLGTGTVGTELAEMSRPPDVVITPLACGALAGGMARVLAELDPKPWIMGVQSTAYPRLSKLWLGEPDPGEVAGTTFADGLADTRIVEPAFTACLDHLDAVISVTDGDLRAGVRELYDKHGVVVEGAAAAPLAALRRTPESIPVGRTVLITTGRNLDAAVAEEILSEQAPEPHAAKRTAR